MKSSADAINEIYKKISSGTGIPVYKISHPINPPDEFVVINSLPILKGVMQKCFVNVNCYVPDLIIGTPDTARLDAITKKYLTKIEEVSETGVHIDFESQEFFRETELKRHFSNIRVSVKLVN